ncbi:hypothetical protein Vretifemale_9990 [Volvox reticuliferus]|uniref:Uncharacterized protein n=1 Tax=Volvox reticuliferus TaxID=1737510 RepID=A0A8J4FM08_9CHLO|nr:hypothetical protein Vretifemale_9990 [Volvox reticuliferus]
MARKWGVNVHDMTSDMKTLRGGSQSLLQWLCLAFCIQVLINASFSNARNEPTKLRVSKPLLQQLPDDGYGILDEDSYSENNDYPLLQAEDLPVHLRRVNPSGTSGPRPPVVETEAGNIARPWLDRVPVTGAIAESVTHFGPHRNSQLTGQTYHTAEAGSGAATGADPSSGTLAATHESSHAASSADTAHGIARLSGGAMHTRHREVKMKPELVAGVFGPAIAAAGVGLPMTHHRQRRLGIFEPSYCLTAPSGMECYPCQSVYDDGPCAVRRSVKKESVDDKRRL